MITSMQSNRFSFFKTPLHGLLSVRRVPIKDERGFLTRLYCHQLFAETGIDFQISQINHTGTALAGSIRGMHFQYQPFAEKKLVSCIKGKVFDVAVDLRTDSETFLQWFGFELSAEEQNALLIPEGFAHGFQTLQDNCEMIYLHSNYYEPSGEGGISFDDPAISINWPLEATQISKRDKNYEPIDDDFGGIDLQ